MGTKTMTMIDAGITAAEINELLDIRDFQGIVYKLWGADGLNVIEECEKVTPFAYGIREFLAKYCTACGGDWGNMILSGIKELYPAVWEAVPQEMGHFSFVGIVATLNLLGIDTADSSN